MSVFLAPALPALAHEAQHAVYRGTLDAFRKIVRFEGARGLYKGFLPATIGIGAGQM